MSFFSQNRVLIAAVLLSTVLGSIHAFSVFVPEWEQIEGANRAQVSFVYSIALVSLTLAVLLGYRLYGLLSASILFLCVGIVAAAGLYFSANLSGKENSLIRLIICYGVLFGGANGVGYGYALQLVGQAVPSNRGMAMGFVTAFYAVGATVTPKAFVSLIEHGGNALALEIMAAILLCVAVLSAGLLSRSAFVFKSAPSRQSIQLSPELHSTRLVFWFAYGSAVCSGLMVIGHAFNIAIWAKASLSSAAWAATVVAFGNMLGGFSIGFYADKLSARVLLRYLPALSALALLLLMSAWTTELFVLCFALSLVGYSYGAIIAVYPVAVVDVFGSEASPKIYGQIFTAWGLAGLVGPWASGWLFDITGSYAIPLLIAMILSCFSLYIIKQANKN